MSWKLVALAPKPVVQAALAAHEALDDWEPEIVVTGCEIAENRPDDWVHEAYLPSRPTETERAAVSALFGKHAPPLSVEKLPDTDWVAETQKLVAPIRAGRFHVHTPDHPTETAPGTTDLVIPAAQAFGTGTGLLAFAALQLWPRARAIASDIDAVCESVVVENALLNAVPLGIAHGQLAMVVAEGMDHALLAGRAPYDLVIANILAGPLIELAEDFADALAPRGQLLLAGLLETQEAAVRAAYRTAGFRLAARLVKGDWSTLWLRRRSVG